MGGKGSGRKLGSKWSKSKKALAEAAAAALGVSGIQPGTPPESGHQSGFGATGESPGERESGVLVPSEPVSVDLQPLDSGTPGDFRAEVKEWTRSKGLSYTLNLLDRLRASGDPRGEIALVSKLLDHGSGTPGPAERQDYDLFKDLKAVHAGIQADLEAKGAPQLPAWTPEEPETATGGAGSPAAARSQEVPSDTPSDPPTPSEAKPDAELWDEAWEECWPGRAAKQPFDPERWKLLGVRPPANDLEGQKNWLGKFVTLTRPVLAEAMTDPYFQAVENYLPGDEEEDSGVPAPQYADVRYRNGGFAIDGKPYRPIRRVDGKWSGTGIDDEPELTPEGFTVKRGD